MANAIGTDISFYQDDPQTPQGVNFIKMRDHAHYVIIRAGQNLWGDRDFKVNWREAKAAGIPRGSYWFYDSRIDPKLQAEKWVSMFEGDFGELPLWGDFEDNYNGSFKGWKNWYNFLEHVKKLIPAGKEIGIYTGYYYWRENTVGAGIPNASLNYFKQYPLWIANYGVSSPLVPAPWDTWTLWQFTDNGDGILYGVESLNIDLNYFNGDANEFRQRFGLSNTPPPPPPPPSNNYRVTVASLKVREGPGLSFKQIGSITINEVVEKINANSDGTWLNVRKLDGSLTGWSFAAYLQNLSGQTPPPNEGEDEDDNTGGNGTGENPEDPTPPPDDEDANWYRVTASALKIRTGPGLEFDAIGIFTFGEMVELLEASPNNEWLRVRSQDGARSGWSFGEYLISIHNPSEEPPPAVVIPEHSDKNWYRNNTASLNLREAPSLTSKIISTLTKNDVFPVVDESNPQWAQIQKLDGTIGWCARDYLVQVSTASRPSSITQRLFAGVTYLRKDLTSPRKIVVHVLAIDLQTLKLEFLVTPSANNTDVLCTRTTSKFVEEFKLHAAINGGYFSYLSASNTSATLCPNGGDPVRISDYAASRGKVYSPKKTAQPVIYIGQKNQFTFNKEQGRVFNAISGDRMVVQDGKVFKNLAAQEPNPRTALGINRNGRWLTLMVVDGRQPGYSEGVTFPELAELLISYGVYTGVNMDGGGSSAMSIRGADGKARLLNSPIEMYQPGKERPVGNHLGLLVKP
jgi:GH25 family lysozyme M1 (1,4-beta-N-acetylmuramidase)/uncharacterized protein YgiM (DUF1202 family)